MTEDREHDDVIEPLDVVIKVHLKEPWQNQGRASMAPGALQPYLASTPARCVENCESTVLIRYNFGIQIDVSPLQAVHNKGAGWKR